MAAICLGLNVLISSVKKKKLKFNHMSHQEDWYSNINIFYGALPREIDFS